MNKATEKVSEFYKLFENKNSGVEQHFADCFGEFIKCLNEADLCDETLENLNDIFEKDMNMFFNNYMKRGIENDI